MNISKRFTLIATFFFLLVFLVENLNGVFHANDFKVYYGASVDFMQTSDPYAKSYGLSSGFYKYSPATLLLFAPATLFSFEIAKSIHFLVSAIFFIWSLHLCLAFAKRYLPGSLLRETLFLSLLLILSAVHLSRELHLGNINILLIFLLLASTKLMLEDKKWAAAILLSILFLLKPYFLILILVLLIWRNFGLLLSVALIMTAISLVPILFIGVENTLSFNLKWLHAMSEHTEGMTSDHTLSSIVKSYSGIVLASYWQLIFIFIVGLTFLSFRLKYFIKLKQYSSDLIISDAFLLMAIIPNLVITDSQHFLFSIPLIGLILIHLFRKPDWKLISLFFILFFFYGMNSNDLLGNPLSNYFDSLSTIGVANILLIVLLIYLRAKRKLTSVYADAP